MTNNEENKQEFTALEVINFKSEAPSFTPIVGKKYIENGKNNCVYDYVEKCYLESPTNSAIINGVVNYTVADGLYDENGFDINKYLDADDVEKICLDFKKFGAYAVQILWNLDKKIQKIKYLHVKKVMIEIDDFGSTTGYYYCFDLHNQRKHKLTWYPKFDGNFKEFDKETGKSGFVEIMLVQRPDTADFYANCDYKACLSSAELESKLVSNALNWTDNQFMSATHIKLIGGIPPTKELEREYKKQIINDVTGATSAGSILVSFSNGLDTAPIIENLPLPEINETFSLFSKIAQTNLILTHRVSQTLFNADIKSSNLGTNKEELRTATQSLMYSSIRPMRNKITNGLHKVFRVIEPSINLKFKDFDWLNDINDVTQSIDKKQLTALLKESLNDVLNENADDTPKNENEK